MKPDFHSNATDTESPVTRNRERVQKTDFLFLLFVFLIRFEARNSLPGTTSHAWNHLSSFHWRIINVRPGVLDISLPHRSDD